jgi:hypothetical protein
MRSAALTKATVDEPDIARIGCGADAASYSLWRFKKLPEPAVVVAAALVGLVVYLLIAPT